MGVLEGWLVVGVPGLVLALALFTMQRRRLAWAGYAVLVVAFGLLAAADRASAGVFGGVLALLYAAGRGGHGERDPAVPPGAESVPEVTRRVARERAAAKAPR